MIALTIQTVVQVDLGQQELNKCKNKAVDLWSSAFLQYFETKSIFKYSYIQKGEIK